MTLFEVHVDRKLLDSCSSLKIFHLKNKIIILFIKKTLFFKIYY